MKFKKFFSGLVAAAMAISAVPALAAEGEPNVTAYWKFGREGVKSGNISDASLIIEDQSGNGNDLKMETFGSGDWDKSLQFSDDSMTGQGGSMIFDGDSKSKTGAAFVTVDGAPINKETFRNGYTMEYLYYFPTDWTTEDRWMCLSRRSGSARNIPEVEQGTMYTAVSNCKEIQFVTANADDNHWMGSAAWSVSMDEGGIWYHIAVVSDGNEISTYVNGCEAFRDYASSAMKGMYADPNDGHFHIGTSWWNGIDKFLQGSLQEVRITAQPLEKKDWLVPEPEKYLGEYGDNRAYELRDPDNYTMILLPDTQNTVEYRPDVMNKAIDRLIAEADDFNTVGVIHLGDVVDDNDDDQQYINAREAFYKIPDAGIKFLVQQGNHDGWSGGIHNYWNSFSGKSTAFKRRAGWYLTNSPNGDQNSSYMFLRAGNYDYLVISLSCTGSPSGGLGNVTWLKEDEAWLESVLREYPNCPTIVTTHDLQNCSPTDPSAVQLSNNGWGLWNIVKKYPQVFMMVGGHSHGSGVEILKNDAGKDVISMLADYQFAYNGGNGFFRYLEFDENADKIYFSTYSPYAAALDQDERTFFDVNFMTGKGNEGEIDLKFKERFAGMEAKRVEGISEGKYLAGEYHTHTGQSKDATTNYMSLANSLAAAFHNEDVLQSGANSAAKFSNIKYGRPFDFLALADHLRVSYNGVDGQGNGHYDTAFYVAVQTQMREIEKMQVKGLYGDKIVSSGFEWDMPGLDHASVGVLDSKGNQSVQGIHAFEWLFAPVGDDSNDLYDVSKYNSGGGALNDDLDEQAVYGGRRNNGSVEATYEAARWLEENYPGSYLLPNHPSRHNGQNGEVRIEHLRRLNDAAPSIVFGFEGMPGNHMSGEGRGELPEGDIRAGADEMIAVTGGVWDAMLSEGRRFYNFTNSDFHFKVSTDGRFSSGYWPDEYSANYVYVEPGEDGKLDYGDVVRGLRSGNSYSVYGNLISDLEFTVNGAPMGGETAVGGGDSAEVNISFTVPANNNYEKIAGTNTGIDVDNVPDIDHIDVIMGHVTGKVDESQYTGTSNTDAKIVRTFTKEELAAAKGGDGVYRLSCELPVDADMYIRLRGVSTAEVDANGDPVPDPMHNRITDNNTRFDTMNDYNYSSLSFYSNPVWVSVGEGPVRAAEIKFSDEPQWDGSAVKGTVSVTLDPRLEIKPEDEVKVYVAAFDAAEERLLSISGVDVSSAEKVSVDVSVNAPEDGIVNFKAIVVNSKLEPLCPCGTLNTVRPQ